MTREMASLGRPVRGVTVAVAVLALVGAGVPAAQAVQGSVASEGAAAAVVKLEVLGNPNAAPGTLRERSCSGVLVGASWVLTAASCFADVPGDAVSAGAPTWSTRATVGRSDATGAAGATVAVDRVVPHGGRDVVLAHLATPVTSVAPVAVGASAPTVGEELTVVGFGRTADEIVPDTAHAATYTVTAVEAGTVDIEAQDPGATICKGDAGGPALRTTAAGTLELVAIHHTAYQGGCLGATNTRQGATETRLDDLGGWVSATTSARAAQLKRIYTVNSGQVHEAASDNAWINLNSGIATDGPVAVLTIDGVKIVYTVVGGQVHEAASNAGWRSISTGISTDGPLAVMELDGVKYVYTVVGGYVHEAASSNGWRSLNSGIPAGHELAVMASGGVKFVYTVVGGYVHEAASSNGWKSLNTGIPTSGPLAVLSLDGVKHVYTVLGGQVHEGASNAGWRYLNSGIHTSGPLAVMEVAGVKHVYTVNGGYVFEAASNTGWKSLNSWVPAPGRLAVLAVESAGR